MGDKKAKKQNNPLSVEINNIEISEFLDREIIFKLDSLKNNGNFYKKYSEIYAGGVYAMNLKNQKENTDWMSQSANSFREIFYLLTNNNKTKLQKILGDYLGRVLTKKEVEKYKKYISNLYSFFSDLTHHFSTHEKEEYEINDKFKININTFSAKNYFDAVRCYKEYIKILITTAIEIHQKIDEFIKENNKNLKLAKILINFSNDSKIYFFSKIDENWLDWLWEKGLLVKLKEKPEGQNRYYMPELEYLARMSEKNSAKVAKIIFFVPISEKTFNPEVIDRFLWIIQEMPAEQIKNLTDKIREDRWIYLMRKFNKSGYGFKKMIKALEEAKEYKALLEIAEAMLEVKRKEDIEDKGFGANDPFYLRDISDSGIFEVLVNMDDKYLKDALKTIAAIVGKIVELRGENKNKNRVFQYEDSFVLYDVDFFEFDLEKRGGISYREDLKNLAAVIKILIEKTIGESCSDENEAKRLFKIIDDLPRNRTIWRLRLFTLAQCPEIFQNELKEAFFRLFNEDNYYEIAGGAEYKKTLKIAFPYLSDDDQRDYVKKVLKYFSEKAEKNSDQEWHKRIGWEILSCCKLNNEEKLECDKKFGRKYDEKYEPKPASSGVKGGMVQNISPVNLADFMIEQIVAKLKNEWDPKKLNEQYKNDDFLNPRGAEGLGDALKEDVKKRIAEYLENIKKFFNRNKIHSHYLYSILRGIEEMLRDRISFDDDQIKQILDLFDLIKTSGQEKGKEFKKRKDDNKSWLSDWITVHKVMADIMLVVFENSREREQLQKKYRDQILNIIKYLLSIKDSPSKEDEKPEYGEPFHVAINSVRGRAYQVFVMFAQNDGKELSDDIKDAFIKTLSDDSLAVRFVIGHYLATFYFRDKKFIKNLFPQIFPKDKKDIYLATWEGYLVNTLYDKLFAELKEYYKDAIKLPPEEYTERKYSKDLDQALAVHLGLAFAHLGLEIGDPLYNLFWNEPNTKRHKEFISFIGRSCLTRAHAGDKWLKENNVSKDKLLKFWDWALENVSDPEALSAFGFWINQNDEIIDDNIVAEKMAKTLEKSEGRIDWDYALLKRLSVFAKKDPENTFIIMENYLLDPTFKNLNPNRKPPITDKYEIKESLDIIYKNGDGKLKEDVEDLINVLIEKGSSTFWYLEDILSDKK